MNYTKTLDPSVPKRKPIWSRRIRISTIQSLIAIIATAFAIDNIAPHVMTKLFALTDESAKIWMGITYVTMFIGLALFVATALKRKS